jgi:hypothetical protein
MARIMVNLFLLSRPLEAQTKNDKQNRSTCPEQGSETSAWWTSEGASGKRPLSTQAVKKRSFDHMSIWLGSLERLLRRFLEVGNGKGPPENIVI